MTPEMLRSYENYFIFSRYDFLLIVVIGLVGLILQLAGKGPEVRAMREFVNLLNSRGGNILVLGMFGIWFFSAAMRLFYHALSMVAEGKLDNSNAILLMGLQFVTGSAFGAAFGSMLKTMTGSDGVSRSGDSPTTNGSMKTVATIPVAPVVAPVADVAPAPVAQSLEPEVIGRAAIAPEPPAPAAS